MIYLKESFLRYLKLVWEEQEQIWILGHNLFLPPISVSTHQLLLSVAADFNFHNAGSMVANSPGATQKERV